MVDVIFDQDLNPATITTSGWAVRINNQGRTVLTIVPLGTNGVRINTAAGLPNVGPDHVWYTRPPGVLASAVTGMVATFDRDLPFP